MGQQPPFDVTEFDEFLRGFAEYTVKWEDNMTHYAIDMPRNDIECRVVTGFDTVNRKLVSRNGKVMIKRTYDDEVLYQDEFQISDEEWEDQFRSKIIYAMKNWRNLVI
jgi:hypothetical protein